jgi:hypothetical protein
MHKRDRRFYHVVRPRLKCLPTSMLWCPLWIRVTLNPSQVIQTSNLSSTIFLISIVSSRKESPQIGVPCISTQDQSYNFNTREEMEYTNQNQNHHTTQEHDHKSTNTRVTRNGLKTTLVYH